MSSDYYFKEWKQILMRLEKLVNIDLEYQNNTDHEKKRCITARHLSGVLGEYIAIYNDAVECYKQNLQVQKRNYIAEVVRTVVARILELKGQLSKLEASNYQFLGQGLVTHRLTTIDAEFIDIPSKIERPEEVKAKIDEIMMKAKEEREKLAYEINAIDEDANPNPEDRWWDDKVQDAATLKLVSQCTDDNKEEISTEMLKTRKLLALIGAHEKSRQIIRRNTHLKLKKETWTKSLLGTLQPQARFEIKERAARLIQRTCRMYFTIKRKRIQVFKRDVKLGIRLYENLNDEEKKKSKEIALHRAQLYKKYEKEWKCLCEKLKNNYLKRDAESIAEDYRDEIRNWFRLWYDEVKYFYNIPKDAQGGSNLIVKNEVPSPAEWLEQYKAYMEKIKTNKGKSAATLKIEKIEAIREEIRAKREQHSEGKLKAAMIKKIMKNPHMHPGFKYPASKKMYHILQALQNYRKDWDDLDASETLDVKIKYVKEKDESNIWMEVKLAVRTTVNKDMRKEHKLLMQALKTDYKRNEEKMPEIMKGRTLTRSAKRVKNEKVIETNIETVADKMKNLAVHGYLKEYPRTKLEDIVGDPNFAGDDLRCNANPAIPFTGDTRSVWWERCRELVNGFHRILLVGPTGSGKTTLVHAMATINDALLFELDPIQFQNDQLFSPAYLMQLVNNISSCAKAGQPAVIYMRHVHRLFYAKVLTEEAKLSADLIKRYMIKLLFKQIDKMDKITVIGSCIEPWLTKSAKILKQFPSVVLMPDMSYSTTVMLFKDWVMRNRFIPPDLDVHSLAYLLRGYSFGYLKQNLQNFVSAERIIKIAAYGLHPEEVYNYILENDEATNTTKPDYERYQKWYTDKTSWGQKEKKDIKTQKEFQELAKKHAEKLNKKKKPQFATSSAHSLL